MDIFAVIAVVESILDYTLLNVILLFMFVIAPSDLLL